MASVIYNSRRFLFWGFWVNRKKWWSYRRFCWFQFWFQCLVYGLSEIKYLALIKALFAILILLLIWAYSCLVRLALLSLCSNEAILLLRCSDDISSISLELFKFILWALSMLSWLSICFLFSSSPLILSKRLFFKSFFSLSSTPYLERALNPLFLFSLLLLIKNLCSSINFCLWRKKLSFSYFNLFNSALKFSASGLGKTFFGASGALVSRVIYFLFQLN